MSTAKTITGLVIPLLAGLVLLTGCNRKAAGPPKRPTTGIVTNDGKPVTDAQVVFSSAELNISRGAITGPDGKFTVRAGTGNGLPAGTYQVVVRASPIGENPEAVVDENRDDIPKIFRSRNTSPLKKTIHDGENLLEIDLSK